MRVRGLHRPERALHAGVVEDVDVALAHLRDRRERPEGLRVVDQPVDAAEAIDGARDHCVDLVALLDVADDAEILDTEGVELAARLRHQLVLPFGHDDARTALAEMERHALADALARTGDDHDLAGHRMHVARGVP